MIWSVWHIQYLRFKETKRRRDRTPLVFGRAGVLINGSSGR